MKQGFFPEQVDETKINKFLVLPAFSNLFAIFLVVVVASPDDIPTCKKKKKKSQNYDTKNENILQHNSRTNKGLK